MTKAQTIEQQPHFYGIPAMIRRTSFLQGRVAIPVLPKVVRRQVVRGDKQKHVASGKTFETMRAPGGSVARKINYELSLSRLTRKQRVRLLTQKCRAAGVSNAAALALAK
jgi:hypothetical protein